MNKNKNLHKIFLLKVHHHVCIIICSSFEKRIHHFTMINLLKAQHSNYHIFKDVLILSIKDDEFLS